MPAPIIRTLCFIALVLSASAALACTCPIEPIQGGEQVRQADVLFLGTIRKLAFFDETGDGEHVTVWFDVVRVWKGRLPKHFEMRTFVATSWCEGFRRQDLEIGGQLIVYANTINKPKFHYSPSICNPTQPADLQAVLPLFGPGYQPGQRPKAVVETP
jgi:hypothetical protein